MPTVSRMPVAFADVGEGAVSVVVIQMFLLPWRPGGPQATSMPFAGAAGGGAGSGAVLMLKSM